MIKNTLLLTSLLLFSKMIFATEPDPQFKFIETRGPITLYERWVRHNNNSVRELKAVFMIHKTGVVDFITLLKSEQAAYKWNPNAKKLSVALSKEDNIWHSYMRYKIPWPMDDQDCCLKYYYDKNKLNGNLVPIYFYSVDYPAFPKLKTVTRITGTKGCWLLQQTNPDNLNITYNIVTDKSAIIPRWVSDPIVYNNLFSSLTALKNILEQNKK